MVAVWSFLLQLFISHKQLHVMPSTGCCVPKCNGIGGHLFPRDEVRRQRWIIAIRRDNWLPTRYSVVCHRHFSGTDYRTETYYGTLWFSNFKFNKMFCDILLMNESIHRASPVDSQPFRSRANSLPGANQPGNRPVRSLEHSLPGLFAPWSESANRTPANSLPGTFTPWPIRSLTLSLPETFAPGPFRSLAFSLLD